VNIENQIAAVRSQMHAIRQQVENLTVVIKEEHKQEIARAEQVSDLKGRYEKSLELIE